jgi:uncharacterized phage protein (predicted DNA packaging)
LIITVEEAKNWLRVDGAEEDTLIQILISAAEDYLYNATGNVFDSKNELAKLFCFVLVTDWYENRDMIGKASEKIRLSVDSMLSQLAHNYDTAPKVPIGLTAVSGDGYVELSWKPNREYDLLGYHVYVDSVKITTTVVTTTSYKVTDLTNGVLYSFQISAIDKAGHESGLSTAVNATPSVS